MTNTLWAVHVTGPDDLLPCASRRLAARNATWINLGGVHEDEDLDDDEDGESGSEGGASDG
jgi:hypothetical protein